jgi:hypothetical protein
MKLMGKRVILTPILTIIGVALLAELLITLHTNPARTLSACLEIILPLATGVLVATITSQENAIELQLTVPKKYAVTVLGRLAMIVGWTICIAILFSISIFGFKLSYVPQPALSSSAYILFLNAQLTWIAPLLWFVAMGFCLALLLRSRSGTGALLGGIWIIEIIFKDHIAATNWLHPVFLFPTTLLPLVGFVPQNIFNMWLTNRLELIGTALIILLVGWLFLHYPEGLLKTSSEE